MIAVLVKVGLAALVFWLTALETTAVSRERAYEMNAYQSKTRDAAKRLALKSAWWAARFELILCVWLIVGVSEDAWLALAAIPGAFYGQYRAVMTRVDRRLAKMSRNEPDDDDE